MGPSTNDTEVKYSTLGRTLINICKFICVYWPLNLMDKFQLHFLLILFL